MTTDSKCPFNGGSGGSALGGALYISLSVQLQGDSFSGAAIGV